MKHANGKDDDGGTKQVLDSLTLSCLKQCYCGFPAMHSQTNSETCILGEMIQLVFKNCCLHDLSVLPHSNSLAELKLKIFSPGPGLLLPHHIDSVETEHLESQVLPEGQQHWEPQRCTVL